MNQSTSMTSVLLAGLLALACSHAAWGSDGGAGIVATGNADITVCGAVAGGLGVSGTRAPAVEFSGGGNTLVLENGFSLQGAVISAGGDTFALGGDSTTHCGGSGDGVFTFGSAGINPQGFDQLAKTGSSHWSVQGTVPPLPWLVEAGSLTMLAGFGPVTVASGATLAGKDSGMPGTTHGVVTLQPGAHLAPGSAAGTAAGELAVGGIHWQAGASLDFQLAATAAGSDRVTSLAAVNKVGSGAFTFNFDDAASTPVVGSSYPLILAAGFSGFAADASDFNYTYSGSLPILSGHFVLDQGGNTVTLRFVVDAVQAMRCHVDRNASGADDGSSWADAYTDLQSALTNPACTEIWVAAGRYKPVVPVDYSQPTSAERDVSFVIRAGVAVYGGFDGSETQLGQRDPANNRTLLTGDIDGNDNSLQLPDWTDIDGVMDGTAMNSRHVVRLDGSVTPVGADTVLDGFVIVGGYADGTGSDDGHGGGLYCDGSGPTGACSPTLANLVLAGNYAMVGGGVALDASDGGLASPTLANVNFSGNGASDSGGGMVMVASEDAGQTRSGTSRPQLTDVVFAGNQAGLPAANNVGTGGSMSAVAAAGGVIEPVLNRVVFRDSSTGLAGGAMVNMTLGGTIDFDMIDVQFIGNHADAPGSKGGAIAVNAQSGGTTGFAMDHVILRGNRAEQGGAILLMADAGTSNIMTLTNVTFSGNQATTDDGGAIAVTSLGGANSVNLTLSGTTFSGNEAVVGGGALSLLASNNASADLVVRNTTFVGNQAVRGGALAFGASAGGTVSLDADYITVAGNATGDAASGALHFNCDGGAGVCHGALANAILWDGNGGSTLELVSDVAVIGLDHSIVRGGVSSIAISGGTPFTDGTGNLSADPHLSTPGNYGGFTQTLLPTGTSAAINAASCDAAIVTDQRGKTRPQANGCDIGAVEVQLAAVTVDVTTPGGRIDISSPPPSLGDIADCRQTSGSCSASWTADPWPQGIVLVPQADAGHALAAISGCGGHLDNGSFIIPALASDCTVTVSFTASSFHVGGTVTGLLGTGLELSLDAGAQILPISGNGAFVFPNVVPAGSSYSVSIAQQPANPAQPCVLVNASGIVSDHDISNVVVNCGPANTYTVGGSLTGLASGESIVLKLNNGNALTLGADGSWVLPLFFASGGSYVVSIAQQPTGQHCSVANPAGTVAGADITNVAVQCAAGGPNLALAITDASDYARYGQVRDYFVTVGNSGNGDAANVAASASFGPAYDIANAQWTCFPSGAASCTPQGAGGFNDVVDLPSGTSITWLVSVPILAGSPEAHGTIVAHAAGAPDASDTDTLVIFRDGVDVPYGDGTQALRAGSHGADSPLLASSAVDLVVPDALPAGIHTLQRWAEGNMQLTVQVLAIHGNQFVRLLGERAGEPRMSAWSRVSPGATLVVGGLEGPAGEHVFLLEGGAASLHLTLP